MTEHNWRRVPLGAYRHRYVCSCGWESPEVDNGDPAAGAAVVRHEIALRRESDGDATD